MIPKSLEEAIAQAKEATKIALEAGCTKLQIELVIPEIALRSQYLAYEFTSLFAECNSGLKVLFPDTGAAALARRDWGEIPFQVTDLGSSRTPVERKISQADGAFLVISPSAVEVSQVEKLCNIAGHRPVVLVTPQLENVSTVGIGYAARQLRERFLSTLESSYYFRPLEGAAVFRAFPGLWQVWSEKDEDYELICEQPQKPLGEALERILLRQTTAGQSPAENDKPVLKNPGFLAGIKSFLKALNQ